MKRNILGRCLSSEDLDNRELINKDILILGDTHNEEFWILNKQDILDFKPNYLLLEVIGNHRFMNKSERLTGMKNKDVYTTSSFGTGYSSEAFDIANILDIPMIGIDTWSIHYQFPKEWDKKDDKYYTYSSNIRETQMIKTLDEFSSKGRVLLIVGMHHLDPIHSKLYKYCKSNNFDIRYTAIDNTILSLGYNNKVFPGYNDKG